jgi:hypothetical protein
MRGGAAGSRPEPARHWDETDAVDVPLVLNEAWRLWDLRLVNHVARQLPMPNDAPAQKDFSHRRRATLSCRGQVKDGRGVQPSRPLPETSNGPVP